MEPLAIGLFWVGYSVFVYGFDHLRCGTASFKTIIWPSKNLPQGQIDPNYGQCTSSSSSSSKSSTSKSPALQTGSPAAKANKPVGRTGTAAFPTSGGGS